MSELQIIEFEGDQLEAVEKGGEVFVSLTRLCDSLGLTTFTQSRKLEGKAWATTIMMKAVAADGKTREVLGLHIDSVPMWLATINESKVAEHVRPKLRKYQLECARVLKDHFMGAPINIIDAKERRLLAKEARLLETEHRKRAELMERLSLHPALSSRAGAALALESAKMITSSSLEEYLPVIEIEYFAISKVAELLSEASGVKITPQRVGISRKKANVVGNIDGVCEVRLSKSQYSSKQVEQTFVTAQGASMIARHVCMGGHITPHAYNAACEAYDWPKLPLVEASELN